jgi:hypothetical protein
MALAGPALGRGIYLLLHLQQKVEARILINDLRPKESGCPHSLAPAHVAGKVMFAWLVDGHTADAPGSRVPPSRRDQGAVTRARMNFGPPSLTGVESRTIRLPAVSLTTTVPSVLHDPEDRELDI